MPDINWNQIILGLIGLGMAWIAYQNAKIHTLVNSSASANEEEKKRLNDLINKLVAHASTLEGPPVVPSATAQQLVEQSKPTKESSGR